jgi:predicted DsbA family dithiol-disulfide isomerase
MRIVYWSDFNCPYSYIGLNRIKKAIGELGLDVDLEMQSFEIEPDLDKSSHKTAERFAAMNGLTVKEAKREILEIERIALEDGLEINYRDMPLTSSRDAHRLVKYYQTKDSKTAQELAERIYEANFVKNEKISDGDVLMEIAKSLNLNESEVKRILEGNSFAIEVELEMQDALFNGITTIPHYILMKKGEELIIPGVLEKDDFKTALKDLDSGEIAKKTFI